jgi:hypothetical protein
VGATMRYLVASICVISFAPGPVRSHGSTEIVDEIKAESRGSMR